MREEIGLHGFLHLYEIPEEFAQDDELFRAWWLPETELVNGVWRVTREARISEEAKAQRLVMAPVENLITNIGIALVMTNLSVANQSQQHPVTQILSVGNGAFNGASRGASAVIGDGFAAGSRKAPSSYVQVGFLTTIITNFASGDAVGTWTNAGFYGYSVALAQNATTTAGTGALMTLASFPWVKGSTAYSVNYVFQLSN